MLNPENNPGHDSLLEASGTPDNVFAIMLLFGMMEQKVRDIVTDTDKAYEEQVNAILNQIEEGDSLQTDESLVQAFLVESRMAKIRL